MFREFFKTPETLNFEIGSFLLIMSLILLIILAVQIIISKKPFEIILLMSAYSLLLSICYLLMDSPDVAMTEVALGSCLSNCVLLNFIKIVNCKSRYLPKSKNVIPALIICITLVCALGFSASSLQEYGTSDTRLQSHVSKYYLDNTYKDTGLPAPVTAILASYRGFDTLGETTVILIAGLAVLLIFSLKAKKNY